MKSERELQQRREAQVRYRLKYPERCKEIQRCSDRKNKERLNETNRRQYHLNPEKDSIRKRRKKFGITHEQFDAMLIAQSGRCAICSVPLTLPCLDHNHKTGKYREILCRFCNLVLGNAKDSISVLEESIKYLKRHGEVYEEAQISFNSH